MKNTKIIIRLFIAIIAMVALPSLTMGQSIEGDWYGKASLQGIELRLNLHIKPSGDGYSSTWDSPDQNSMGIPSTTTTFTYPDFTFTYDEAGLRYAGKVDPAYTSITGTLFQGGQKFDILFTRKVIAPPAGSTEALKLKFTKKEVYITMRDGVKLFTSIYAPKDTLKRHPVLITRTPYGIEPGGEENFNFYMQVYSRYPDDGYIMVFQDVRGRFMSEGVFEDIRPVIPEKKNSKEIDESTDTWDTVDWLLKNVPGNNGKVGIFGISYPGFYSTMGIIGAHPAVKAVSPQAPVASWFIGDDMHHNGAFYLLDCFGFFYSNGQVFRSPSRRGFPRFTFPNPDGYDFFLSLGAIKNIAPKFMGDSVKFWKDAFAHPDYDDFWKARDPRQYLKSVTPAVMTVGGWFDAEDLYGALHTYQEIEKQNPPSARNTIVMGPWSHGQWAFGAGTNLGNIYWGLDANLKFAEVEKKFFDYYLKDEGTEDFPEALVFVTGENKWQNFATWPPKNTVQKILYFQPSGAITFTPPTSKTSFDEYVSDPMKPVPYSETIGTRRTTEYMTDDQRFAAKRPDVMVYQTDILADDITLTGPVTADLFVSTSGTDADYVVKLIDVFPIDTPNPEGDKIKVPLGGYQMLVRGDVFRGKYRNSFEKPEAFVPGKVTEVSYEMPDVAHTFKKGHRIMVQVQNSWFPLVDRNPQKFVDIYKCSDTDFQEATHRIYHDSKFASSVKVNVLQ